MQMVSLTLRVMSRPDTSKLSVVYQNLGLDYDERVLPSIGNEVLKAIVAQFDGTSSSPSPISAGTSEPPYCR